MSYSNAGLFCAVSGVSDGPSIWIYQSADAHGDVDAAGYFSDGVTFGMKANDIVIVNDTNVPTLTIHRVASVSGTAATISAATLS